MNKKNGKYIEDGIERWYLNDQVHREDGPAVIWGEAQFWYKNNLIHREDGPAVIEKFGHYVWMNKGVKHREGGPAEYWDDGDFIWWVNGVLHREDGPAKNYEGKIEYRVKGEKLSQELFEQFYLNNLLEVNNKKKMFKV